MGKVTVNGLKYNIPENASVSVCDGVVIVNGVVIKGDVKADEIVVHGSLLDLKTDLSVTVNGTVRGNVNAGGSVSCDAIGGNVNAGGSVNCDDVNGNVTAGGSVNCDEIKGKVL